MFQSFALCRVSKQAHSNYELSREGSYHLVCEKDQLIRATNQNREPFTMVYSWPLRDRGKFIVHRSVVCLWKVQFWDGGFTSSAKQISQQERRNSKVVCKKKGETNAFCQTTRVRRKNNSCFVHEKESVLKNWSQFCKKEVDNLCHESLWTHSRKRLSQEKNKQNHPASWMRHQQLKKESPLMLRLPLQVKGLFENFVQKKTKHQQNFQKISHGEISFFRIHKQEKEAFAQVRLLSLCSVVVDGAAAFRHSRSTIFAAWTIVSPPHRFFLMWTEFFEFNRPSAKGSFPWEFHES